MTMYFIRFLSFLSAFLFFNFVLAQEDYLVYWEPQLAVNYEVAPHYRHTFALISRNFVYQDQEIDIKGRHLDLAHFSSVEVSSNSSLAIGLLYRFREIFENDQGNEFRLIQQFSTRSRPLIVRFGHRFRTEQRFITGSTIHRFRYRLTLDFPLQGEQVDLNEAYLILNSEMLLSVANARTPQYDQRFAFTIGWRLTEKSQLQAGLEHRWENYLTNTRQNTFLTTAFFVSL
ncbi:MAG: DUF2490 domain-containing protein [Eudoraea sp.]|nr:DUF2490 domain-containing protein [Eudoraea sp.]